MEISFHLDPFKENFPSQCVCVHYTCGFVTVDIKQDLLLSPLRLCLHVCMCFLLVGNQSFLLFILRLRSRELSRDDRFPFQDDYNSAKIKQTFAQKLLKIAQLLQIFDPTKHCFFFLFFLNPFNLLPLKYCLPHVLGDLRVTNLYKASESSHRLPVRGET